jgi:TetR/AcrR family transcriptional regulator, transcriptional repressor of bet genes
MRKPSVARAGTKKRRMARSRSATTGIEPSFEDQRRRQIVSAVVACMSEEGFEQTTMRNIAERAGVSIGMLNYYFKSKKELVVEAIRHANDGVARALASADAIPFGPRRLEFILRRTLRNEYQQALPLAFRLAVMGAAAHDADLRREVVGWMEDGRSKFERSIRVGVESGHYRSDIDPKLLSAILYGAMTGLAVEAAVSEGLVSLDIAVEASVLILRLFESQPQQTARTALKNSSSAAISDQLEQQLLADPELTTDQAMTLASAFRAMHASMKRPGRDKA